MFKVVIDMMGGDLGPSPIIEAIKKFSKDYTDSYFYCVGKKEELSKLESLSNVEIIDARDVIKMDDNPLKSIKMTDSSMIKGISIFKEKGADAIISNGGTGPFLTCSTILLGRIEGVKRPALVTAFPTIQKGKYATILDVGANSVCTSEELVNFAVMGKVYSKVVFETVNPRISLLSNGTEAHKGTPIIKDTNKMLSDMKSLNFIGNIEARDVLRATTDVVVCDGFSGNVMLKSAEGALQTFSEALKRGFKLNLITKLGYLFSRKGIKDVKETFNYKATGGAILLGVNGVVIKGHGSNDAEGVYGSLKVAMKMVNANIVQTLKEEIGK